MSLLEELQKKKSALKVTDTILKTKSGNVFLEKRNALGFTVVEEVGRSSGYVVDLKPDLQLAQVVPGLYMGSQDVTQEENLLCKYKISHVISIGVHVNEIPGFKYTYFEALDVPEFDMQSVFLASASLIKDSIESGGVVFVHCNAGVSRSSAVVIAYLIKYEKLNYDEAFHALKQARSCIKPNEGFVNQLKRFQKYCVGHETV